MYVVSRYVRAKKEWVKFKKQLSMLSRSNMRINDVIANIVCPVFEANGLADQARLWMKEEVTNLKQFLNNTDMWSFNMQLPSDCNCTDMNNGTTNCTCQKIKDWVSVRGVSDDAADMHNFRVKNESNVSLSDVDSNLDAFENYEKEFVA
jgi:hypothetical protein